MRLPFFGRLRNPAFFERVPIMFTPTSLGNATQKPDGNPTKTSPLDNLRVWIARLVVGTAAIMSYRVARRLE